MKKVLSLLITGMAICLQFSAKGQEIQLNKFDKRGVELINSFMNALIANATDELAAAKTALPFIHRSEYDNSGTSLKRDRLDYSFKKAWQNAKFYQVPVSVTRVQKQSLTAIGFGATAQAGTSYKVWIAKKSGVRGLPAPLNVFFPSDGSGPTLNYYGSL